MNRLKAEEAHKIANDNSEIIQEELDKIFGLVGQAAKEGRFTLNYTSEISDAMLITPIQEQLASMGYDVQSHSLKDVSLTIKW